MPTSLARRIFGRLTLCDQIISPRFDVKFQLGIQIAIQAAASKYVRQT